MHSLCKILIKSKLLLIILILVVSTATYTIFHGPTKIIGKISNIKGSLGFKESRLSPYLSALAYQAPKSALNWEAKYHLRNLQIVKSNDPQELPGLKAFWQKFYEPTFSCMYPVRVGRAGIGGKWVCNPYELNEAAEAEGRKVVVYSFGSSGDYSFEAGINAIYGDRGEIHTFDKKVPTKESPYYLTFHHNLVMGQQPGRSFDSANNEISINTIRKKLGHSKTPIDILMMDIEGGEYEVLKSSVGPGCPMNANMVLIETHQDSPKHYHELFENLQTNCKMDIFFKEPSTQDHNGDVIEWGFVRVDWDKRPKLSNPLSSALAFQFDTKEGWNKRFELRNTLKALSNSPSPEEIKGMPLKKLFQIYWQPTFSCDDPVRVGNSGDGGKWVCNPYGMRMAADWADRKVLIYSLGSAGNYAFEEGIHSIFGERGEIHTFDKGKFENPPKILTLHQNLIVGMQPNGSYDSTDNGISITAIREKLGHVGKAIDIFKIDIEGSEYEVLRTYIGDGCPLNSNMIMLETHWDSAVHYSELFEKLQTNCGMELYYKEPNIQFSDGSVVEWCFVKVDWDSRP